ncbi:hypothetical protein CPAR01_13528 [Colletotrichum paranaense]|uniref:Uncharacterized protein n=1 Tax=Colletotrichum paranaense TaxID=1914294 RepID=A0ABQ9S4N6_9PEZI|nr:uncharacterized protein CPAR01_13528 [Colletotrichum paranaense]KAK1524580.1 hypothetical protein CPAR01_13528 [Colletotrichum paranaense]
MADYQPPSIFPKTENSIFTEASKKEVNKDEVSKGKAGEGEGPASKDEAGEGETGEVEVSKDESTKDKASKGGLAESKKANDWIVELQGDGLEGTILMLGIIHGHFDQVPFSLSVRRLHDLLVLCNKYNVLSLLRPWSWHWLSAMRSNLNEPYVLWVAWETGDVLLFRDMVVRIAEGVPISTITRPNVMWVQYGKQRVHWTPPSGQINDFPMIPLECLQNTSENDLSGLIALTRVLLIEAAVKPYRSILSQMKKTHPSNLITIKNNCVKNCIPSGVGSLVLASMTDNFTIWDPRLPFHFTGHLKLVVDHPSGIKITIPQGYGNCLKMFSDELTNVRSVMTAALKRTAPLSKDQQMHLEKRASQLGLRVENVMDKGTMHMLYALGSWVIW